MSDISYLSPENYKDMKWKNGLGVTRELAIGQHNKTQDDSPFLWRISIAGVEEDGPFSIFPNIDRHLMLIEGNGITLDGGRHGVGVLYDHMQVYGFPGDIEIDGRLSDGPIKDLNLMVDRRFVRAEMTGFYVDVPERVMLKSDIHFIHLVEGSAPVTIDIDGELRVLKGGCCIQFSNMKKGATIMPMGEGELRSKVAFISIDLK